MEIKAMYIFTHMCANRKEPSGTLPVDPSVKRSGITGRGRCFSF